MKIRLVPIFLLSFLFSCFSARKKSTNTITTHGNLALVNGTLIDGIGGNPFGNSDALLKLKMVIHGGEIIKGGI